MDNMGKKQYIERSGNDEYTIWDGVPHDEDSKGRPLSTVSAVINGRDWPTCTMDRLFIGGWVEMPKA